MLSLGPKQCNQTNLVWIFLVKWIVASKHNSLLTQNICCNRSDNLSDRAEIVTCTASHFIGLWSNIHYVEAIISDLYCYYNKLQLKSFHSYRLNDVIFRKIFLISKYDKHVTDTKVQLARYWFHKITKKKNILKGIFHTVHFLIECCKMNCKNLCMNLI